MSTVIDKPKRKAIPIHAMCATGMAIGRAMVAQERYLESPPLVCRRVLRPLAALEVFAAALFHAGLCVGVAFSTVVGCVGESLRGVASRLSVLRRVALGPDRGSRGFGSRCIPWSVEGRADGAEPELLSRLPGLA